ncbi:hypothetical protein GCM10011581_28260 [Saccharopolyspora subtropica]|uniref:Uncharacterized protein n=1 Tax=Saccharopolyspora thermophila TaxID=89367 RepID=A0A917ND50_9PSEU|nr:hypothetical protein GCM10011581_28260 [Saccharopolyspora subtropica]
MVEQREPREHDTGYDEATGDRITPESGPVPRDREPEPRAHPRHLPADMPPGNEEDKESR